MQHYFDNSNTPWTELGDGVRRKIVGHTPDLMAVLVQFDKGSVGLAHAHDAHDQIAFVVAGAFEVEVAGCGAATGVAWCRCAGASEHAA